MFKAQVIAASSNTFGDRITTMLVTYPRFIHSEMCRHRMFSRNTASSRAIPFAKIVEMVQKTPVIPIKWMKDHKGMQGTEFLDQDNGFWCESTWRVAKDYAIKQAIILNERYGLTKQLANRLLEPFMWTTELITGTEWENFFALRFHPEAEIHMQYIAELMLTAYNEAEVKILQPGEWHIPYEPTNQKSFSDEEAVKIATARCAQTSYTIFNQGDKLAHDAVALHDRLLAGKHLSPFEHCAKAMTSVERNSSYYRGELDQYGWYKNFRGFIMYRSMIEGESQSDNRVKH